MTCCLSVFLGLHDATLHSASSDQYVSVNGLILPRARSLSRSFILNHMTGLEKLSGPIIAHIKRNITSLKYKDNVYTFQLFKKHSSAVTFYTVGMLAQGDNCFHCPASTVSRTTFGGQRASNIEEHTLPPLSPTHTHLYKYTHLTKPHTFTNTHTEEEKGTSHKRPI